jgi:hypothetical protein
MEEKSPKSIEALKEDLDTLKIGYVKVLNDKDVLINWGKPQLEALYNTRIGIYKIEQLQLELHIKGLKRKLELVRSAINKYEKIDFATIELTIAAELAHIEEQIMLEAESIVSSKNLLSNLDSPQRSSELRDIFRSMAKNLHPDVNPDLTDEQNNIWHLVLEAYQTGDLNALKALSLVYEKEIKGNENQLTEEQILLAIETIKEGCKVLQNEIDTIKSAFPFTIEVQIKDEDWVKGETDKIKEIIFKLKEYEKELSLEYKNLVDHYE